MKRQKYFMFFLIGFVLSAVAIAYPTKKASAHGGDSQFIAESSLLAGLAPGAAFPFIDTTPHKIAQAHIAITDSSSDCHPGAAPPDNIKVLVGQAGVALVSVMDKTTNTGISTTRSEEHTSELQSRFDLVCRLLLEKKKKSKRYRWPT